MHIFFRIVLLGFLSFLSTATLFSQPAGYYNTATGTGANLKTQLYNIIKGHTPINYDDLWAAFQTTDNKTNDIVWDMYSDIPGGTPAYEFTFVTHQCDAGLNYDSEGDCFNREHSFPASWFNDASPMYSDLFHLCPTDGYVNNKRGNYPFGEVGTATWTSTNGSKLGPCSYSGYTGTVFEPIDEYKGDFARNYFYMATRYENIISGWHANGDEAEAVLLANDFPVYETWFLNMLGEWHVADPVSLKETNRNNTVYNIQNNRNPFIDHPEWVYSIWGVGQLLSAEPTNHAASFSAHCITLNWADATGAVVPTGYLVSMSSVGFGSIATPGDGNPVADDLSNKNVAYGVKKAVFGGLTPNATYYFKIFAYTGSGGNIDYKTDGTIQQVSLLAK
jgi:endonuclease I